ncbi:MAG: D-tagatose-bisphosphate aldolase, class II, non-catalytic subunit [Paracoccaceae bacterium]|nr:D-tagatose-bisphosphate aldolase, class II, non-catalytic subunit [Paracoccaceae bacterium]
MDHPLRALPVSFQKGQPIGITSVCSAHPIVIEAALRLSKEQGAPALIEATCNQVNQDGGYTGMTPRDFRIFVENIAEKVGFDPANLILGGDHLGPNPWRHLPADQAMQKAEAMIAAFAEAGFTKLHLDTSMGCLGEATALPDAWTAERAARLAAIAEQRKCPGPDPVYVIGTEVPVPGGAVEELDHLKITTPQDAAQSYAIHRQAFEQRGLSKAFSRVIALVVQPGVEFGHSDVVRFDPAKADALSASLMDMPGIVFEAHSTDYQTTAALSQLVQMGFAILKVGPWLTFALREALYALDPLADILEGHPPRGDLMGVMEAIMIEAPDNWQKYYAGDKMDLWLQRHFSMSDRIRYYWPHPKAEAAVARLRSRLAGKKAPETALSQYLNGLAIDNSNLDADSILIAAVQKVLRQYAVATGLN